MTIFYYRCMSRLYTQTFVELIDFVFIDWWSILYSSKYIGLGTPPDFPLYKFFQSS